jgi:hypothetical protein
MPAITTGKFLKKDDVSEDGDTHTIKKVREENVEQEGKPEKLKWVMYFEDLKPLILNTTNINRCIQAFKTNESEEWEGQKIIVYADPDIEFGGKIVGGVRLRAVKQVKPAKGSKPVSPVGDDDGPIPF